MLEKIKALFERAKKGDPVLARFKGRLMMCKSKLQAVEGSKEEVMKPAEDEARALCKEIEEAQAFAASSGKKAQEGFNLLAKSVNHKPVGLGSLLIKEVDKVEKQELSPEVIERNKRYLDGDELKDGIVANDLHALRKGDLKSIKQTFRDLDGKTSLSKIQITEIREEIVKTVLMVPDCCRELAKNPKLCGEMIAMAQGMGMLTPGILKSLGDQTEDVACSIVFQRSSVKLDQKVSSGGGKGFSEADLNEWLIDIIPKDTWNDKKTGLGARVINNLWNAGDFDLLCTLITKDVDPSLPFSLPLVTSRGTQEGVWSGFVQPVEHLLGNYVKLVAQFKKDPKQFDPEMQKKLAGAQKVLETLDEQGTNILTDFDEIMKCEAIAAFKKQPGTVWGFEDVRLPYVQAARESKKGDEPLRMIELWTAIEEVLKEEGYDRLLIDPDKTIPEIVATGVAGAKEKTAEKKKEYEGADLDEFLKNFEEQATAYLTHLANQIPKGQYETAEQSGMDMGKLMGGLACNAGLWWALENKKPVYYCLDGLNMDEALDYKAFKNARIKAHFEGGPKHAEVITLGEIREILKNWSSMKDIVFFIERGSVMKDVSRVEKWIETMKRNDEEAGKRPAPVSTTFKPKLDDIGVEGLWEAIEDHPYEAMKVTVKFVTLEKRVAKMANLDILPLYLEKKCQFLIDFKIIPANMAEVCKDYLEKVKRNDGTESQSDMNAVIKALPESLQAEISGWRVRVDKFAEL
ncbi:hypothetical protein [Sedimentitalea todarodis]|uniref:Uncharacterized protein n=1 Tax=Sedimentitalea todarodis TaxID=1631240 RepID=A0ABU3VKP3_9RHOB|nr:hypothetical protein [Sedimentitalea todarodis]MDU9006762.1 hypothetical protein [Sedimentitalea todarodis]